MIRYIQTEQFVFSLLNIKHPLLNTVFKKYLRIVPGLIGSSPDFIFMLELLENGLFDVPLILSGRIGVKPDLYLCLKRGDLSGRIGVIPDLFKASGSVNRNPMRSHTKLWINSFTMLNLFSWNY